VTDRRDGALRRIWRGLGRIRYRLLAVNLLAVLVPIVGLEFAQVYERQLLDGLERDMQNQATLVKSLLESDLGRGSELGAAHHAEILTRAARTTRTRIRLVDRARGVVSDSHRLGPPEGPEPPPPALVRFSEPARRDVQRPTDPVDVMVRPEVVAALAGTASRTTRVSQLPPAVYLFVAEPIRYHGAVAGAVYVTRSTQPVLVELHRIRSGLVRVLCVTLTLTGLLTLALAFSISRPLERLSRAAGRIASGQRDVPLPRGGGGEITDLGESFSAMTEQLGARARYISDFAADVAHEFKSPLTSIRGAAELLAEGAAEDPAARRRFLENIELDAQRLDRLVSRLLELSRIEASSEVPVEVDLPALLRRAIERSQGPDQTIELSYESPVTRLRVRETDLETALLNVIDNALRFSPDGARVRVVVTSDPGGRELAISVADQGPGVPEAHRTRVFDRFFTTESDREGTGLGLSIVSSVAKAHGGSVEVDTTPGGGATFTMRVPTGR
jgi:two-component system, OmpR family, sensor histidine kinase ChvG